MLKKILISAFSIAWIALTFYPISIFTNAGTLFTYCTGIFGLKSPDNKKEIVINNAKKDVSIWIDSLGIPHIYADSANNLAFGLGYMHARDRYFQMELITRMVQGTLAEILGDMVVVSDEFWAPYLFEQKAKEVFEEMAKTQPDVYNYMISYSEGINTYLSQEKNNEKSPEYALLGTKPRVWENHYPLFLIWYMSHSLTYYDAHISRQNVISKLKGNPLLVLFTPNEPENYPYIAPDSSFEYSDANLAHNLDFTIDEVNNPMAWMESELFKSVGSNNWSVGAIKSATGNSMLCNDPHLDLTLPGPWYEARMFCNDYSVAGFSIPCSPWVISGHNKNIAWGVTNGEWDLLDRILLDTNVTNQYKYNNQWLDYEIRKVEINIKGKIKTIEKQFTIWGHTETIKGEKYALKWHPAQKHSSVITFHKLAYATNWDDFTTALSFYKYPPQNFVYADNKGNTGLKCAGNLPYKPKSFEGGLLDSNFPAEVNYIPFDKLPGYYNNKRGFSASANQISAKTNYYLNFEWPENYRAARINGYLSEKEKISLQDMMALQYDKKDISFNEFLPVLEKYGNSIKSLEKLKNWDGIIKKDSYEAILYEALKLSIRKNLADIINKKLKVGTYPTLSQTYIYLLKNDTIIIGDTSFTSTNYFEKVVESALNQLKTDFGNGYETRANHNYFSTFEIKHLLQLPGWGIEAENAAGNGHTPNVITYREHGASMRTVIEMSDPVNAYTIQAGGQSGRVNSSNYANQVSLWKEGNYKKEQFTSSDKLSGIVSKIEIKKQ